MTPTDPIALSHADAARLWMSSRDNPMVVTAVLPLDGVIGLDALRALLRARLTVHPRFRARIEVPRLPWRAPRWREDPSFSLDRHVARVTLPPAASEVEVARTVSALASAPLSLRNPPWRVWLLEGAPAGSVLVVRVHHAVADGLALLGVLFAVSDEGDGALPPPEAPPDAPARAARPTAGSLLDGAASLARLVRQRPDAAGRLSVRPGPEKRVAWSAPVALEPVRAAAHAAGAHVNDLVLAALAGALRALLDGPDAALHALVPVALAREPGGLGNQYASVFVALPVHVADRAARLRLARDDARRARASAGLSLGSALVDVLGSIGGLVSHAGVELLSRRASVVASNVAGPPAPLHLGGRAVTALRFAAPSPGAIPLSVSVASYDGALSLTVLADAHLGVSPDALVQCFVDELAALVALPTTARRSTSRDGLSHPPRR